MSTGMIENNNQAPQAPNATPTNVRAMESQVLTNIQTCITRLEVKLEHLEKALDKHDGKLDKISDDVDKLRSWRITLISGFAVGALLISSMIGFVGWTVNKAVDLYFTQSNTAAPERHDTEGPPPTKK